MQEQIVKGKKYRILTDATNKVYHRLSFWTHASDVELSDGEDVDTRITELIAGQKAKLLCKSTASSDSGKTVKVSDGANSWSAKFSNTLEVSFTLPGQNRYTISVLTTSGSTEYTTSVTLSTGEYLEIEIGLDKTTWTGLKNIVNAHLETKYCSIGDQISLTLSSGEEMIYRIAAINHDQEHQIIFEPTNCMKTGSQMNATNTNSGGWNSSNGRKYLNETFYNMLPTEVKSVISERKFKTSIGSQSSTLQEASDLIWLPREYEVFGSTSYAATTEAAVSAQFPIYATSSNRIKLYGKNGSAASWWLSSPGVSGSGYFCGVTTSGTAHYGVASTTYGLAPCFHIIASN